MKKIFTALFLLMGFFSFSQTKGYFRYDSIQFEKVGANAEFILLNGTRNITGGVLTNIGNGRTAFVTPSGGGGSGGPNSNKGSGFRWAIPNTDSIKTFNPGYGTLADSTTSAGAITIKADSTVLQPKNLLYNKSVSKNGITIELVNDAATPTDTSYYGMVGTKGWKGAALVSTSGGTVGQVVTWQGGKLFGLTTVSGGSSPPFRTPFRPGLTPNAPTSVDSFIVCDTFISRGINIWRDGIKQFYGDTLQGYTVHLDTIFFHPPFYTGERIDMEIWASEFDSVSLCSAAPPPSSWIDLDFPTQQFLTESPAHVWNSTNSNYTGHGLSATTLTGDGGYRVQYNSSSDNGTLMGWNTANSNTDYTGYEYGIYLGASGEIFKIVNGTTSTTGVFLSNGQWAKIKRKDNATTPVITLEKSVDGTTWLTPIHTFSSPSSGTLYFGVNPFQTKSVYNPQYIFE